MCTVTLVPHEEGVRILCNRDERRSRPPAIPPRTYDLGGRLAAFPLDPRGGGTWIGVNDAHVAVALLNLQAPAGLTGDRFTRSRGLIVRRLLRSESLSEAVAMVERLDPFGFLPFQLVIVHGRHVAIATCDHMTPLRLTESPLDHPLMFTSSSLGDALVAAPRRRLFERLVTRSRSGWRDGQARFHDHQWPTHPQISVRMERPDALTVSRTRIELTDAGPRLSYEAPLKPGRRS